MEEDKLLVQKRQELKERFLREEITPEEYNEEKNKIEKELETLEAPSIEKNINEEHEELQKEVKRVKNHRHQTITENPERNTWRYIAGILAIILVISIGMNLNLFKAPSVDALDKTVVDKTLSFVNENLLREDAKATLTSSEEQSGVYLLKLSVNGQTADAYATKDGKLFFPTGINMNEKIPQAPPKAPAAQEISADDDPSIGPSNATITIIEFSDYQCPFCAKAEPTIQQILKKYEGKIRFVYRDFPLGFHKYAQKAAEASEAADEQGKFWEYHDLLFEKQAEWSTGGVEKLKEYAQQLGLNTEQFNKALDSGKYEEEVKKDFNDGQSYGVTGTPAFYINGKEVSGAQPYETFEKIIEQELNKS